MNIKAKRMRFKRSRGTDGGNRAGRGERRDGDMQGVWGRWWQKRREGMEIVRTELFLH